MLLLSKEDKMTCILIHIGYNLLDNFYLAASLWVLAKAGVYTAATVGVFTDEYSIRVQL